MRRGPPHHDPPPPPGQLKELARLFLKLGTVSFGGPAAHTALMQAEVVQRRQWLTPEAFLDLVSATNLIPGPNSTELAIHIGHRRAGWPGLLVAGLCFILPATLIVGLVAWAYVRYGALPQAAGLLYGVKPVIIAVVAQALYSLGRAALKTKPLAALGLAAVALNLLGVHELLVLLAAGLAMVAGRGLLRRGRGPAAAGLALLGAAPGAPAAAAAGVAALPFSLDGLFFFFLKVGSMLFGSGYVLLAFLRADLVQRWHWLSEGQLLDAIAVGQFTPGPLFTTATFIGFLLHGPAGAAVGTAGIFLPAFVFVALSAPYVPRLRSSPLASAALDGVNVASLALMAVVSGHLGVAALVDGWTLAVAALSALLMLRYKVNSAWLVLGGALLGLAFYSP